MKISQDSWQAKAKAKAAEVKSRIPEEWKLQKEDLELAKKQRKLIGQFFDGLLDDGDLDIIRNDSVQLVEKIKSRHYTAMEVTRSYCKAAAVAHQIVSVHHTIFILPAVSHR